MSARHFAAQSAIEELTQNGLRLGRVQRDVLVGLLADGTADNASVLGALIAKRLVQLTRHGYEAHPSLRARFARYLALSTQRVSR